MNEIDKVAAEARPALLELKANLEKSLGRNLASFAVYGSAVRGGFAPGVSDIDVIVVLADTATKELVACSDPLLLARHSGRIEAMILKEEEIPHAADVFPLFYDDIQGCHAILSGSDPFRDLVIKDAHRRFRIEQELREVKIRMRRAVCDTRGDDHLLAGAISRKVKQIRGPLYALLALQGRKGPDTIEAVLLDFGKRHGIDLAPLLLAEKDPVVAHAAFRKMLDVAIEDVDRLGGAS